jgi:hypothetical protein
MQEEEGPFPKHKEDGVNQFEHFADNEQPNPEAMIAHGVFMHMTIGT